MIMKSEIIACKALYEKNMDKRFQVIVAGGIFDRAILII